MKKVKFPKTTMIVDVGKDLGMEDYTGIKFEMWKDPSRKALLNIISTFSSDTELMTENTAKDFFESVSSIIVDSSIDGVSFDTAEDVEKSFDNPNLPWGFVYSVIVAYVVYLINESDSLKKVFGLSSGVETSGVGKSEVEHQ